VGADRDPSDRPPPIEHLADYRQESFDHLLLSAPVGDTLVCVWVVPRSRPGRPFVARQDGHVATVATLDPVSALPMAAECLNALYRLQIFLSQATAQLVDQAQALHLTVQLRDEQLCEASDELESRGALID
jgi:hypothetical protein